MKQQKNDAGTGDKNRADGSSVHSKKEVLSEAVRKADDDDMKVESSLEKVSSPKGDVWGSNRVATLDD